MILVQLSFQPPQCGLAGQCRIGLGEDAIHQLELRRTQQKSAGDLPMAAKRGRSGLQIPTGYRHLKFRPTGGFWEQPGETVALTYTSSKSQTPTESSSLQPEGANFTTSAT